MARTCLSKGPGGAGGPSSSVAAGFTLAELLVVMAIIMGLAAAAVPAISAFRRGQRLDHAGRMVQSALNDARRRAITLRARHVVAFYIDTTEAGEVGQVRHAVRIYQEPTGIKPGTPGASAGATRGYFQGGYVGEPLILPNGVRFHQPLMECRVHQGEPDVTTDIFRRKLRGERSDTIAFRRDGTIEDRNDSNPSIGSNGANIFLADEQVYQVPDATRADVMMIETDAGGGEVRSKGKVRRSFVDVNLLTGRSLSKTFDIGPYATMLQTGGGGGGN